MVSVSVPGPTEPKSRETEQTRTSYESSSPLRVSVGRSYGKGPSQVGPPGITIHPSASLTPTLSFFLSNLWLLRLRFESEWRAVAHRHRRRRRAGWRGQRRGQVTRPRRLRIDGGRRGASHGGASGPGCEAVAHRRQGASRGDACTSATRLRWGAVARRQTVKHDRGKRGREPQGRCGLQRYARLLSPWTRFLRWNPRPEPNKLN